MSDAGEEFVVDVLFQGGRIVFHDGGLRSNLKSGSKRTMEAAYVIARQMAPDCENYMKQNAPWTDRTGNARNGLHAQAYREGSEIGIVLYGSVSYQVYLETRFSGRYAIIEPTVETMGPVVMSRYNRMLDRM